MAGKPWGRLLFVAALLAVGFVPVAGVRAAAVYRGAAIGVLDYGGDDATTTVTYATEGAGFWADAAGPYPPVLTGNEIWVTQWANGSLSLSDKRAFIVRTTSRADLAQCDPRCKSVEVIDIRAGGGSDFIRVYSTAPATVLRVDCGIGYDALSTNIPRSRRETVGCEKVG